MAIRKSWLFTAALSLGCASISAAICLTSASAAGGTQTPDAMFWIHMGSAFVGAFCLARLIIGAPAAMAGPAPKSILAQATGPQGLVFKTRVSSNGHFFSFLRGLQIIAVLLCLMTQFVSIQPPAKEDASRGFCPVPHKKSKPDSGEEMGRPRLRV